MRRRGFTLLEVLVATAIMAIAVTVGLSALRTSMRNAGRQLEMERAASLARRKMDELLAQPILPHGQSLGGVIDPVYTGGVTAGWTALVLPAEAAQMPPRPNSIGLERIQLELWWESQAGRRSLRLETYRRGPILDADAAWMMAHPAEVLGAPL
ncbi:MAG: prepilin-type N-terminal cleavage/methylation domain-containing protein [Bryobacteraceae bacterium]